MRLPLHIAWRYLRSPKSHNAINIVSGVSAAAVCVVTAAMVCVLSVMNGFGRVVEDMFSNFDAELKIVPAQGKVLNTETQEIQSVLALPYIALASSTIEETALIEYNGRQLPAVLLGVDSLYPRLTHIDSILVDGHYSTYDGAFERTVMGQGLAWQLGIGAHFVQGIHLYAPKRNEPVNMLRPDRSFHETSCFIAGIFAVNQVKYDDHYMLVSRELTEQLFDYQPHQATALCLSLTDGTSLRTAEREIRRLLGPDYLVQNRYEQQEDFYHILRVEKWLTALLLVFILIVAAFNLIGSLTMLIIDKREDIRILSHLGANLKQIRHIFLMEGWLISLLGSVSGLMIGLLVCLSQQQWGWLHLGNGSEYVLSAYPVSVQAGDLLLVAAIVLVIGFVAAWIPAYKITIDNTHSA